MLDFIGLIKNVENNVFSIIREFKSVALLFEAIKVYDDCCRERDGRDLDLDDLGLIKGSLRVLERNSIHRTLKELG